MKVFIEQTAEKFKKNIFDKGTGVYEKAIDFHATYPYPYGYIVDTLASDGDELDCYIITNKKFVRGSVVECEPVGMIEYFEDGVEDHKILATLQGEEYDIEEAVKVKLLEFNAIYFKYDDDKKTKIGGHLGKEDAIKEVKKARLKWMEKV